MLLIFVLKPNYLIYLNWINSVFDTGFAKLILEMKRLFTLLLLIVNA